ncbi:hypothetical protein H9U17_001018 [Salmonella enterica]|nr:hypothetical protein [Salmonella enterica subsp. enterica]EAB1403104.1 hypothetical protein [Salmonella enterica]EBH9233691.1 hypothetical protein [Salmonella enterica subsp. enterica serovar Manhattan]EAB4861967.1 hypothetical protein [Salmonella enterica]EAM3360073.1 hypothetical protein [Salmonella enterica]
MLFSANFFTNEVTNAKAVIKFGTEANKKLHPKIVSHVSFANHKSAFAGFKAHREQLIAAGYGENGKLSNGIRKAIDRVKPAKEITPDHIVSFTVTGCAELFHLIIAGESAFVSAPNTEFADRADCVITFGRRKEVEGKAFAKFTKSGNPYFAVHFNSHFVKEEIELPAYEGEEKARIENSPEFIALDELAKAVSAPVVDSEKEELKDRVAELEALLAAKTEEVEILKARVVVAPAPVKAVEVEVEETKEEVKDLAALWEILKDKRSLTDVEEWNKYVVRNNGKNVEYRDLATIKVFDAFEYNFVARAA